MNVIIVDDEAHNIENLQGILTRHYPEMEVVGTATTVKEAFALLQVQQADLLFLDIRIGKETGFDLLDQISQRDFEVIFVSAYDKYGIRAVKFAALDYILKPIDETELEIAITRAREKITQKAHRSRLDFLMEYLRKSAHTPAKIALPLFQETRYVKVNDIIRCEAQNTYVHFYLENGEKILICRPLKEYDELLAPQGFIRCHQTHLVNPVYIRSLLKEDGGVLLLTDGTRVPVSKSKKEHVKQLLNK